MTWKLVVVTLLIAFLLAPRIASAEDHLGKAIAHTKEAIEKGNIHDSDVLVLHAEAALAHVEAMQSAGSDFSIDESAKRLKAAIAAGKEKNFDAATKYSAEALEQFARSIAGAKIVVQRAGLVQASASPKILPARMFTGPDQYPPNKFKAYGIVAFSTRPTIYDKSRYEMICSAYVSSIEHYTHINVPLEQQMVTLWPIETSVLADRINEESRENVCADATKHYDLVIGQEAIALARRNKAVLNGQGPFLLAWSPGVSKGEPEALVLAADMSDVVNNEQAKQIFTQWVTDIQENPELWNNGWNVEKIKLVVRLIVDKYGKMTLELLTKKD